MTRTALRFVAVPALIAVAGALVGCGADRGPGAQRASHTTGTSHSARTTSAGSSTPAPPPRRVVHRPSSTRIATLAPSGPSTAGLQRSAESFVRHFYGQVDAGQFDAAWNRLPETVRASSGSLESWRDGYATTLTNEISELTVDGPVGGSATVSLTLRATDLDACADEVRQRFAIRWTLRREGGHWVAGAISAQKVSGRTPRRELADCPSYSAASGAVTPDEAAAVPATEDPGFCETHPCIPNYSNGRGTTVMCADGEYSHSGGIQGACSSHGGVAGGGASSGGSTPSSPSYTPSTSSGGTVHVHGYTRSDGTYVAPYTRRAPCSSC